MKASKGFQTRIASVSRRAVARASRPFAAGLVIASTMTPANSGAVMARESSAADLAMTGIESAVTDGGGRTFGMRDSWSISLGSPYFSTGQDDEEDSGSDDADSDDADSDDADSDDAAGTASLEQWMIESVLDHWGLVLRGEALDAFQSGHTHPMSLLERWAGGMSIAGYGLITSTDDRQACRLLLEDFAPSPDLGTKEDVLAGFLTQPAVCQKLWAAATAWSQTLDRIGALPADGMSGLDKEVTDPIGHAVFNAPGATYSWAGEYPLEGPAMQAVALWRGSGLGSNGGAGGFAAAYYEPADEPGAPPYCGHVPGGDTGGKVMVPVPCPLPPTLDLCSVSAVIVEVAAADSHVHSRDEPAPQVDSFDVPQCSAVIEAEKGLPTGAAAINEIRYEWTERWWRPDGSPVDPLAQGENVEDAGNCNRPSGAEGKWVLSLCADEIHITYSVVGASGGVRISRTVAPMNRNVVQADWSWSPPPARPRFGALLAGVMPPSDDDRTTRLVSLYDGDSEEQAGRAFAAAAEHGWRPPPGNFSPAEQLEFVRSRGGPCPALWQALVHGEPSLDEEGSDATGSVAEASDEGSSDEESSDEGSSDEEDPGEPCLPLDRDLVESWGWERAEVITLNCSVPRSRLSREDARQREMDWVYVSDAPLYGSDSPHRPFAVDDCMVDATMSLFELADSHGIELKVSTAARSYEKQLELRRENCPAEWTEHQLMHEPAKRCNPHTAVPGKSRHNMGLAIDFNCDSFDHPCFRWLAKYAARLGFYTLSIASEEPWHWAAAPPLQLH